MSVPSVLLDDESTREATPEAQEEIRLPYPQLMLTIEKPRIERYLRNLLNEPLNEPLRFEPEIDLYDGSGPGIVAAVRTLRRALERCGKAGPPPVLAAELEHGILTSLLLGQRH